jgi:hypothetical protein
VALADRQEIFAQIEELRAGRKLIAFANFDRQSTPDVPGVTTQFHSDSKEALFRVLKESGGGAAGVDLLLYTRGGDTNSVWPIVNLLREFDQDFEVLVPFRAHSAGTLVAMAAKSIVMGPISELSPIDPTTGNQFNPVNPGKPDQRLGISVEDVVGFVDFARRYLKIPRLSADEEMAPEHRDAMLQMIQELVGEVHPLAIGNVYRVHRQIERLARLLLELHPREGRDVDQVIGDLTTRAYSHLHMFSRQEAQGILGEDHVVYAGDDLASKLDHLLRVYEDDFHLRERLFLANLIGDQQTVPARFFGAVVESAQWAYAFETRGVLRQSSEVPPNIQIQLPPGQPMPLIPGLPRKIHFEVQAQGWIHNSEPKGVTV